ncbi:MAG: 4,5-dihydroxyphthalate decarboxylase [Rhodospirillaceae bacterium]|nr:4,5-dihydroxyphthalate decarboxylase [Rhodospirillaceae bacterium]|tara:strand:+ start:9467 stop:10438 length:972 start_codon:yes stop_codon:yes gene_type:complete
MPTDISFAIDRYDRHFPFFDGTLDLPDSLHLTVFQAGETSAQRDGAHRHKRMLQDGEFDAAEVSFSSFIMAKARGLPFSAIPAFPRRLFSQTQMYVKSDSDITEPSALAGKRIGLQSFQTTLAVLAKGDLHYEYGVDLKSVTWVTRANETVSFEPKPGWDIEYIDADADLGIMLANGEIDALFFSRAPTTLETGSVRRLFSDPKAACGDFYGRNGFFPIMHIIAIKDEVIAANSDLPRQLLDLYHQAKTIAETYMDDPGWSQLPWARIMREEQSKIIGTDIWPVGFSENRKNIERFIGYSHNQELIDRRLEPEELFHESVLDS